MKRTITVLAGGMFLAAGCSTSPHITGNAAPAGGFTAPAATQPANPVPILRRTGAQIPPGMVSGDHDVFGNRMADGMFHGHGCTGACGEDVTVYTPAGSLQQAKSEAPGDFVVDDSHKVIIGTGFWVYVTGVEDLQTNGTIFYVKPATIARRVQGRLLAPSR